MKHSLALRQVPRENLERMANSLRKRARNEKMQYDRLMGRAIGVASAMGGASLMGSYVGMQLKKGQSTSIKGLGDVELAVGIGAAIVGAVVQAKSKKGLGRGLGEALEGMGTGALAYWAGSRAENKASRGAAPAAPAIGG